MIWTSESLGVIVRYGGSFDSDAVCGVLSGGGFVVMPVFWSLLFKNEGSSMFIGFPWKFSWKEK